MTEGTSPGLEETLPRDYYVTPRIHDLERERIFWRDWFCGGRLERIPDAGDFLVLDVAGESVLVVRGQDETVRAFYNVCRHRGSRLRETSPVEAGEEPVGGPAGRLPGSIQCPYHAWTYGLDGRLISAPHLSTTGVVAREDFPLHPVGLETWGGFFFVNLSPTEAESSGLTLRRQLGRTPDRVVRYPLAELRSARRIVYDVMANWKVIVENYNECYHCGPVHPELCDIVPAFKKAGGAGLDWESGVPHREGAWTFTRTGTTNREAFPGLSAEEKVRHKGELVYPNFMLSLSPDHAAAFLLWPRGPGRTLITCDFLFHPDAIRRGDFDPSDAVEFWDLVNRQDWSICERVQQGMSSRVFRTGYYAPMENLSLDIRRYVREKLGDLPGA